jgi:hypothetical protein
MVYINHENGLDQSNFTYSTAPEPFQREIPMSQPVAPQKPEKRVPGIDLLRGLCITAVVLHHINLRIHFRDRAWAK